MMLWPPLAPLAVGGRSTVMKTILWLAGLLLVAFVALAEVRADQWVLRFVAALLALAIVVAIATFLWFAFTRPSELRSERFLVQMERLRTARGDSIGGPVIDADPDSSAKGSGGLLGGGG